MDQQGKNRREEINISADDLVAKVKELINEGNVRRLIIKTEDGRTLIEVPLTTGGAVAAADDEPAAFGRYVHEVLATVDLSGANVEPVARTLARRYGVTDARARLSSRTRTGSRCRCCTEATTVATRWPCRPSVRG